MYLAMLSKEEKELFLGLAFELASVDGNYSAEEQAMINGYCQEMQIEFDQEKMVKPIDDLLDIIEKKCDIRVKKIVIFEIIGLAMADGNYDKSERILVSKMEADFKMEVGFVDKCETILNEYITLQSRINQFILD